MCRLCSGLVNVLVSVLLGVCVMLEMFGILLMLVRGMMCWDMLEEV